LYAHKHTLPVLLAPLEKLLRFYSVSYSYICHIYMEICTATTYYMLQKNIFRIHPMKQVSKCDIIIFCNLYIYVVIYCRSTQLHVRWIPCHYGLAGDGLQLQREAVNILEKHP
jgi:hypothetical protein